MGKSFLNCSLLALAAVVSASGTSVAAPYWSGDDLDVHVAEENWCDGQVYIEIHAAQESAFADAEGTVRRVVASLGDKLKLDCPQAAALSVVGLVDGRLEYSGSASLQGDRVDSNIIPFQEHRFPLSKRDQATEAQTLLAALGFDPGPIDGMMGRNTRAAISQFQATQGLPASGTLNTALLASLREAFDRKSRNPAGADVAVAPQPAPANDSAQRTPKTPDANQDLALQDQGRQSGQTDSTRQSPSRGSDSGNQRGGGSGSGSGSGGGSGAILEGAVPAGPAAWGATVCYASVLSNDLSGGGASTRNFYPLRHFFGRSFQLRPEAGPDPEIMPITYRFLPDRLIQRWPGGTQDYILGRDPRDPSSACYLATVKGHERCLKVGDLNGRTSGPFMLIDTLRGPGDCHYTAFGEMDEIGEEEAEQIVAASEASKSDNFLYFGDYNAGGMWISISDGKFKDFRRFLKQTQSETEVDLLYVVYHNGYSHYCADQMTEPRTTINTKRFVQQGNWGTPQLTGEWTFTIRDKYLNSYERAKASANSVAGAFSLILGGGRQYADLPPDVDRFLKKEGCSSPRVRLFEENLERFATGQPSIQEEEASKNAPPAPTGPRRERIAEAGVSWTVPEEWIHLGPDGFVAVYETDRDIYSSTGDFVQVIVREKEPIDDLMVWVNHFRSRDNLPAVQSLAEQPHELHKVDGRDAYVFFFDEGNQSIIQDGDRSWTITMWGPTKSLTKRREQFDAFIRSFDWD